MPQQSAPDTAHRFEWDDANEEHLARHGVTAGEVEQAFRNGAAFSPNTRGRAGWQMRGHTDGGRRLVAVVVWTDERDRVLRAVTARDER